MNEVGNDGNWVSSTSLLCFKVKEAKKPKTNNFPSLLFRCRAPETVKRKPVLGTPGRLPFRQPFQNRPSLLEFTFLS